jgi:hypothetical protein
VSIIEEQLLLFQSEAAPKKVFAKNILFVMANIGYYKDEETISICFINLEHGYSQN